MLRSMYNAFYRCSANSLRTGSSFERRLSLSKGISTELSPAPGSPILLPPLRECAHAVSVEMKKMRGVESVEPRLNEGKAIIKLKPGNTVRSDDVIRVVREKAF